MLLLLHHRNDDRLSFLVVEEIVDFDFVVVVVDGASSSWLEELQLEEVVLMLNSNFPVDADLKEKLCCRCCCLLLTSSWLKRNDVRKQNDVREEKMQARGHQSNLHHLSKPVQHFQLQVAVEEASSAEDGFFLQEKSTGEDLVLDFVVDFVVVSELEVLKAKQIHKETLETEKCFVHDCC